MIIIARLRTARFEFEAYGTGPKRAKYLLQQAWERHREQTGASDAWSDVSGDVEIIEVWMGKVYRDGTII